MKKLHDEVVIADVYHTIKSPIVSIKSMLFVLGRNKDVEGNKLLQEKVSQIEEKVNLLHKRSEIFLNYIFYKEGAVEFLYSFFNLDEVLSEVIKKLNTHDSSVKFTFSNAKQVTIMADQDQIKEALRIIMARIQTVSEPGSILIAVSSVGKMVEIKLRYTQIVDDPTKKPINSDEECVAQEESYIAHRIIEMHGGTINRKSENGEVEVSVILPMKAKFIL